MMIRNDSEAPDTRNRVRNRGHAKLAHPASCFTPRSTSLTDARPCIFKTAPVPGGWRALGWVRVGPARGCRQGAAVSTSGEPLQRRIRPLTGPTRRAGEIRAASQSLSAHCVVPPHGLADALAGNAALPGADPTQNPTASWARHRDRGRPILTGPLPQHPACGSAPGCSRV